MAGQLMHEDKRGKHPNSLAALEPTKFKKGIKPIGAGRPKGRPNYKTVLHKYLKSKSLTKMPDGSSQEKELLHRIVLATIAKACQGDVRAAQFIFERAFGKEPDKMELTGKDGNPLEIDHGRRLSEIESRLIESFGSGQAVLLPPPTED